jgi:hypothetical protein
VNRCSTVRARGDSCRNVLAAFMTRHKSHELLTAGVLPRYVSGESILTGLCLPTSRNEKGRTCPSPAASATHAWGDGRVYPSPFCSSRFAARRFRQAYPMMLARPTPKSVIEAGSGAAMAWPSLWSTSARPLPLKAHTNTQATTARNAHRLIGRTSR